LTSPLPVVLLLEYAVKIFYEKSIQAMNSKIQAPMMDEVCDMHDKMLSIPEKNKSIKLINFVAE